MTSGARSLRGVHAEGVDADEALRVAGADGALLHVGVLRRIRALPRPGAPEGS